MLNKNQIQEMCAEIIELICEKYPEAKNQIYATSEIGVHLLSSVIAALYTDTDQRMNLYKDLMQDIERKVVFVQKL